MSFWQSLVEATRQPSKKTLAWSKGSPWVSEILARASTCRACFLVRRTWTYTLVLIPLIHLGPRESPYPTGQHVWTAPASPKWPGSGVIIRAFTHDENPFGFKTCSSKGHESFQNWGSVFTLQRWVLKGLRSPPPCEGQKEKEEFKEGRLGYLWGPSGTPVLETQGHKVALRLHFTPTDLQAPEMLTTFCLFLGRILTLVGENWCCHQLLPFSVSSLATAASPFPLGSNFIFNNIKALAGHRTEDENKMEGEGGSMLPGGTQGEFFSIFSHVFAPARSISDFPTLAGLRAVRAASAQVWPLRLAHLYPHTTCTGAAKPAELAEESTSGEESQTVLSLEFSNNFKMFHEILLPLIEQTQPSSPGSALFCWRKWYQEARLQSVFEYCQAQLLPPHLSLFYKGLWMWASGQPRHRGPADTSSLCLFILRWPASRDSCLWTILPPGLHTARMQRGRCHRKGGPRAWWVCVDEDHCCCHQPTPRLPPSSTEPAALTGSLGQWLFLLTLSAATFSSDKELGPAMKDISQNPLYASSYKYLAFLEPRHLRVTDNLSRFLTTPCYGC